MDDPQGIKEVMVSDKETGVLMLDRILHTSTHYPANYGFIPRTYGMTVIRRCAGAVLGADRADDPGAMLSHRRHQMLDQGRLDDKIICIPFSDPT